MDDLTKQDRLAELDRICSERGVPCTMQRRLVLEAVLDTEDHPTAEQVHQRISAKVRGISRATIHRNLEVLVEMDLIGKACHHGAVTRYDARTGQHHHLVCTRCDKVIDFHDEQLDCLAVPDTSSLGFEIVDVQVLARGLCRECRDNA